MLALGKNHKSDAQAAGFDLQAVLCSFFDSPKSRSHERLFFCNFADD